MARSRRSKPKNEEASREPKELAEVLSQISKEYGAGTVSKAVEKPQPDRISTGVFILDLCTLGGIPHSHSTMLIGDKHAGKTMLASKIIGNAQRMYPDKEVLLLDIEGTFDATWAETLGVDTSTLNLAQPDTGEMAVDIADAVVGSYETSLVVIDSLAMLLPTKEAESSAEDVHVGLQARLINAMVRKLTGAFVRERKRGHNVAVVFLNQWRTKIGGFSPVGDPRTMPGGRAIEHLMGLSITLKNKENKGRDAIGIDTVTYNEHPFTINKNKMNTGPRSGEFTLVRAEPNPYGLPPGSVENTTTMLFYAKKFGIYSGGGSRWTLEFGDYNLRFGKAQEAIDALNEDPQLHKALWVYLIQLQARNVGQKDDFIARIPGFYD